MRSPGGIDGRNPRQGAARCGYPIELVSRRKMLLGAGRAGTLHDHDARAIGGPDRRIEERAVGREAHGPAAGSRSDLVQRPTVIRPRDVREPLPVGRPGGHLLLHRIVRQPSRRAARQIHHVQPVQRAERDALAIRRGRRFANLPHQHLRCVDTDRQMDHRPQLLVDFGGERDIGHLPRRHRDAVNLAAIRDDDGLVIGREPVSGIEVAGKSGFLVVAGDRIDEPLLVAARQVAQPQPRFCVVPRRVDQPLAVR